MCRDAETAIVAHEAGVDPEVARSLVEAGQRIRSIEGSPLREVASTRTLIMAAALVADGRSMRQSVRAAVTHIVTNDHATSTALEELVDAFLPPDR